MRAATLGLLILAAVLLQPGPVAAAPVPVRFAEGVTHGFLQLRTVDGALIASGDLLQVVRGGQVEKRMVFHFKDGSMFEEAAVFAQQQVYTMHRRGLAPWQRNRLLAPGTSEQRLVADLAVVGFFDPCGRCTF